MAMPDEYMPIISPIVVIDHDRERYKIQMELPGVKTEDIDLEVSETSVCIRAVREDANIGGCYFLAHPVNVDETDAAFDGSMLWIEIPFKVPIRGKRVEVRSGTLDMAQEEEEERIELERF
ncbi:Hsp20/alpha crystallin family protein [Methanomassiliicoccus luminyensis]|jgi:HSP20 family protein|uniref:Hsp20/alpha crystallin family protein n=2 Tax=Methanomassiliicoccus luminyensis TaxID=1080712 RepID=UPI0003653F95|nr:Hsp20/alpha crystallin family protein [Methanomassiliicoccus luminyensis]